jgi:hypothetical protein
MPGTTSATPALERLGYGGRKNSRYTASMIGMSATSVM